MFGEIFSTSLRSRLFLTNLVSSYTVIDEADELVDIDWDEDMKMLLSGGGKIL